MDIFGQMIQKRRSIRDYKDIEVPIDLIKEVIADACEAPSAGNRQPWAFIVIKDKGLMRRLSDESKKNLIEDMPVLRSPIVRMYRPLLKDEKYNVFYNAPCLIYITGPDNVHSASADCSLAAAYLMLSASVKGLGTCWIDLGSHIRDPKLLEEIGLPKGRRIIATIIIGYPKQIPARPPRKPPVILMR